MNNTISIIGYGWLGNIIGKKFKEEGFGIKGTTTQAVKLDLLKSQNIEGQIFNEENLTLYNSILSADHVICCIPPSKSSDYEYLMSNIAKQFSSKHSFIFISSTGIYPQQTGNYTEDSDVIHSKLNTAETIVRENFENHLILRCAGLFGENRHPGKFISGKTGLSAPASPVNLIHGNDVTTSLYHLIRLNQTGTFNLSHTFKKNKKEFYTEMANQLNLSPPEFIENSVSPKRTIDCNKIAAIIPNYNSLTKEHDY